MSEADGVRAAFLGHEEDTCGVSGPGGLFEKFFLVIQNPYDLEIYAFTVRKNAGQIFKFINCSSC